MTAKTLKPALFARFIRGIATPSVGLGFSVPYSVQKVGQKNLVQTNSQLTAMDKTTNHPNNPNKIEMSHGLNTDAHG